MSILEQEFRNGRKMTNYNYVFFTQTTRKRKQNETPPV